LSSSLHTKISKQFERIEQIQDGLADGIAKLKIEVEKLRDLAQTLILSRSAKKKDEG
jgi:hypothetical protein